jgi:hypothetical protein
MAFFYADALSTSSGANRGSLVSAALTRHASPSIPVTGAGFRAGPLPRHAGFFRAMTGAGYRSAAPTRHASLTRSLTSAEFRSAS